MNVTFENTHCYKILSEFTDQLNEHWCVSSFLQALPVIWAIIYQIFKNLFLTQNGRLNACGIILSVFSGIISLFVIGITNFKAYHDLIRRKTYQKDIEQKDAELELRKAIFSTETTIEGRSRRFFIDRINTINIIDNNVREFIKDNCDSKRRIVDVMDEMRYCFEKISNLSRDRIFFSAAINKGGKKWEWITTVNLAGTASISELVSNPSTFSTIVDGNLTYVYENDKRIAATEGRYYWDSQDESSDRKGSIICWEISQEVRNTSLRMIISISTYGERIWEDDMITDEQIKELYEITIRDTILRRFEGRLIDNLILYAIQNKII